MAFAEDLSAFFDTDDFAEIVTYDGTQQIPAIFDAAFFEDVAGRLGVESSKPACLVRSADVPTAAHGKTIKRGAVTYHVVGVQPDGTGLTLLVLEKQ